MRVFLYDRIDRVFARLLKIRKCRSQPALKIETVSENKQLIGDQHDLTPLLSSYQNI